MLDDAETTEEVSGDGGMYKTVSSLIEQVRVEFILQRRNGRIGRNVRINEGNLTEYFTLPTAQHILEVLAKKLPDSSYARGDTTAELLLANWRDKIMKRYTREALGAMNDFSFTKAEQPSASSAACVKLLRDEASALGVSVDAYLSESRKSTEDAGREARSSHAAISRDSTELSITKKIYGPRGVPRLLAERYADVVYMAGQNNEEMEEDGGEDGLTAAPQQQQKKKKPVTKCRGVVVRRPMRKKTAEEAGGAMSKEDEAEGGGYVVDDTPQDDSAAANAFGVA